MNELKIATFTSRGFEQNGYLIWRTGAGRALAIDPGADAHTIVERMEAEDLELEAILLTHAHIDHLEGVPALVKATGAPVYLHEADRPLYDRAADQGAMFGMRVEPMPAISHGLEHGQKLDLAAIRLRVKHVPGHSPGHVVLIVEGENVVFVGDVIFRSSIGRTDLWGGDFPALVQGIREHIFDLPDDVVLYSGHGPPTTVGHERTTNPFLIPSYGGGLA